MRLQLSDVLLAALIAAVGGTIVAWVNRWTAIRVARDTSQRTYRLACLQPFLTILDKRIIACHEIIALGPALKVGLEKAQAGVKERMTTDEVEQEKGQLSPFVQRLNELSSKLQDTQSWRSDSGLYVTITADKNILRLFTKWVRAYKEFWDEVLLNEVGLTAVPERLDEMRKKATNAFYSGVALRSGLEDYIFVGTPWWRKTGGVEDYHVSD